MKPDQWDGYIAICLRGIVTLTRPAHTIMRVLWEYSEQIFGHIPGTESLIK